jgi:hypothetical protein
MPVKPPTANQQDYTLRPIRVYAAQYHTGDPLPPGGSASVEPLYPAEAGPYVTTATGVYPLHDTDWILSDPYTGLPTLVILDGDFQAQYVKATGPPVPG